MVFGVESGWALLHAVGLAIEAHLECVALDLVDSLVNPLGICSRKIDNLWRCPGIGGESGQFAAAVKYFVLLQYYPRSILRKVHRLGVDFPAFKLPGALKFLLCLIIAALE